MLKTIFYSLIITFSITSCSKNHENKTTNPSEKKTDGEVETDIDYLAQLDSLSSSENKCSDSLSSNFFECKEEIEKKKDIIWRKFYSKNNLKIKELNLNSPQLEQLEQEKLKYKNNKSLEIIIIQKITLEQSRLISEYYNNLAN